MNALMSPHSIYLKEPHVTHNTMPVFGPCITAKIG